MSSVPNPARVFGAVASILEQRHGIKIDLDVSAAGSVAKNFSKNVAYSQQVKK